ncbi:hypothetical protein SEA_JACOREN57_33 [Mycobacterium phage JacoRen57]|nr:hypothetical protein SEA_JACOREN57_33 [Mycobacterium phage JacoRen57]
MRVRVNFTVEVDAEQYREAMGEELTKVEIRERIQNMALNRVMYGLGDEGVKVELLGRNNVYDPKQRLTVAEHLVTS